MKTAIIAIAFTFAAAGIMVPDSAEARPSRSGVRNSRASRSTPKRAVRSAPRANRNVTRRVVRSSTPRVNRNMTRRTNRRVVQPRRYRRPLRILPGRAHFHRFWQSGWYRPAQVTLTNYGHLAFTVRVRAGNSPVCVANPEVSAQVLVPGASLTIGTHDAYVCYQRVSLQYHAVSPWFRAMVTSWNQSIGL